MQVYLVGGAVRDQLLGYPIRERDWVVVGATPEMMLQQGYLPIGRAFPVFLHPNTHEEYALARTERKTGAGYHGFTCINDPNVSLEEDLARRDLTINAIAMDAQGNYIDPYNGIQDLKLKRLRHVSTAFIEDPVRVLRVARFMARYAHLGFTVDNTTRMLMYAMVQQGELNSLVPERTWKEWQASLTEANPEQFILTLRNCGALPVILPEIHALFGIPSNYNNQIQDTGVHFIQNLAKLAQNTNNPIERFAGSLIELSKANMPITTWPLHLNYAQQITPLRNLCKRLHIPNNYYKLASLITLLHNKLSSLDILAAETCVDILEQTHALQDQDIFMQLLNITQYLHPESSIPIERWITILTQCKQINASQFIAQGLRNEAIGKAIYQQRVRAVNNEK